MMTPRLLLGSRLLFGLSVCLAGCASSTASPPPSAGRPTASPAVLAGPPVSYAWTDLRGRPISTEAMAGRITVIGFIATYDVLCQAQVRFLENLHREHVPRVNVAVVVLEAPENKPMVQAFVDALELPFPVAMADPATIRGEGPFAGLHHVPSIVVLDRDGRERLRHVGALDRQGLEDAVVKVEIGAGLKKGLP